ncbi:MAG: hypothetical protein RMJ00_04460 [Nitrososphaerota archaeon]|nr:hypothetical protein [Candidatus Bathyarchaeota archaeon]MCX8161404.1 hypothetical protein [Candidatus Bathyarchaeota archaeon]MDW8061932.1 hypothetical protein [Nitrososphaerota archaeon]
MLTIQVFRSVELHIVIYGFPDSVTTNRLLEILSSKRINHTFHTLNSTSNVEKFLKAVNLLRVSGVPDIPDETCLICLLKEGVTWEELVLSFATPMVVVFKGWRLVAIGIAPINENDIFRLLSVEDNGTLIPVYTYYGDYSVKDPDIIAELEELLLDEDVERSGLPPWILPSIISLAAVDSINPCTFLLFTAILLLAVGSIGRGRGLTVGLSFIIAVFIGYYLLGLGLSFIMSITPYLKYIVGLAGLTAGLVNLARGFGREFKPGTPEAIRRFVYGLAGLAYVSPLVSFTLGFIVSLTLLPCSGGPYFVGIALLSNIREPLYRYTLLLLYDAVFISPLLLILLLAILSSRYHERLNALRTPGKAKAMQITGGLVLASISIYLILF